MNRKTIALLAVAALVYPRGELLAQPTAGRPPGPAAAEPPAGPAGPAPRGFDGKPDLSGFWRPVREPGKPGGNLAKDEPGFQLPLTPAGRRAQLYTQNHTPDPEALCTPGGIPRHNGSGLAFEILHTPQRIATLYLYNTQRIVPIGEGLKPDDGAEPLYFGHAAAHWEGDTLVIETRGLKDSFKEKIWLDENGNPTSDQTTVVERWSRPDARTLHLVMTVTDPKYLTRPLTFTRNWTSSPGQHLAEYSCNENNVDGQEIGPGAGPIGPDGNRGFGYDAPLPKDPPGPEAYFN